VKVDDWEFIIDLCIDTFFIIDVLLNLRTAYWLPTGFLETDPKKILRNYLRTWLVIDVVASLPLTYLTVLMHTFSEVRDSNSAPVSSSAYAYSTEFGHMRTLRRAGRVDSRATASR
jgi:hypothetical protein